MLQAAPWYAGVWVVLAYLRRKNCLPLHRRLQCLLCGLEFPLVGVDDNKDGPPHERAYVVLAYIAICNF